MLQAIPFPLNESEAERCEWRISRVDSEVLLVNQRRFVPWCLPGCARAQFPTVPGARLAPSRLPELNQLHVPGADERGLISELDKECERGSKRLIARFSTVEKMLQFLFVVPYMFMP